MAQLSTVTVERFAAERAGASMHIDACHAARRYGIFSGCTGGIRR
jgi:hypothetical protein